MIAVIVGDHHRAQPAQIEPSLLSPDEEVALTNAAIDKHPLARRRVLHNSSVPTAAAGQYVQSKH